MDTFSLEDDDAKELFITQTPSKEKDGSELIGLLGDPMDFSMPCRSIVGERVNVNVAYFDISDDDFFEIPYSQKKSTAMGHKGR